MNSYIIYKLYLCSYVQDTEFTLEKFLFVAFKLTKNADFDKYSWSGYSIGFHARECFSLSDSSGFDKNVIIFGTDMSSSSSVHIVNKMKTPSFLVQAQQIV